MLKHILAGKRLRLTRKTQDIDHILIHYVSTLAQLYRIEEALKRKGKQVNISMYGVDTYNPDLNQQTLRFTNKMCFNLVLEAGISENPQVSKSNDLIYIAEKTYDSIHANGNLSQEVFFH